MGLQTSYVKGDCCTYRAKGDPIADLYEDIAAEEKARATYKHIIDLTDDVDIQDSLKFLREREVIHAFPKHLDS